MLFILDAHFCYSQFLNHLFRIEVVVIDHICHIRNCKMLAMILLNYYIINCSCILRTSTGKAPHPLDTLDTHVPFALSYSLCAHVFLPPATGFGGQGSNSLCNEGGGLPSCSSWIPVNQLQYLRRP
jgi:hypothetical protein